MALASRYMVVLSAVAASCTADVLLTGRSFLVRKKPFNRGARWVAGAFVCPTGRMNAPYHETTQDELVFPCRVTIVDPHDSALVVGMADHMAAAERIEDIFIRKAHGFMPAAIQALNATFATAVTAGSYSSSYVQQTNAEPDSMFIDPAFEAGYDVSSVIVRVHVTVGRLVVNP